MITFEQWISANNENGMRSSLGIVPPSYGAANYPPLYFTPISAGAVGSLERNHGVKCTAPGKCSCTGSPKKVKKKSSKKKK